MRMPEQQQQTGGGPPHWRGATYDVELSETGDGYVSFSGGAAIHLNPPADDLTYFAKLKGTKFRVSFVPVKDGQGKGK